MVDDVSSLFGKGDLYDDEEHLVKEDVKPRSFFKSLWPFGKTVSPEKRNEKDMTPSQDYQVV